MINLNTYIVEKLRINKNTDIVSDNIDLDTPYLLIHKITNSGKTEVYVENIVKIIRIEEKNEDIILTPEDDKGKAEFRFHYIMYGGHIILAEGEWSNDKCVLFPKREAIDILRGLKNNDYKIELSYFDDDTNSKCEVRYDSKDYQITDEEIKNVIINLLVVK